jgi:hypothetical protein
MGILLLLGLLALWSAVSLAYARPLRAVWREPVFKAPVLVLESDDWGAGPAEQSDALQRLSAILEACHDATGRPASMTLGIILETADRDAMRAAGGERYLAIGLDHPCLAPVLAAIRRGAAAGVFAPQLHGLAHYWEPALIAVARDSTAVRAWFEQPGAGWTETLPASLQSRWIDARSLPSRPLPAGEVAAAVAAEIAAWKHVVTGEPLVAVPTTFIWDDAVEAAYAAEGVSVLMTPGKRHTGRDAAGRPSRSGGPIFNGQRGQGGILLLVRDVYFEPVLGHPVERLAAEVAARCALGRPAIVETHRFNFCGPRGSEHAFDALAEALDLLLQRLPSVRFASSAELGRAVAGRDPRWLERGLRRRSAVWARRALRLPGFGRAARVCGLALPLRALGALA